MHGKNLDTIAEITRVLGIEAQASSPEELSARLRADIAKWAKVIDRAGIPKQ